MNFVQDTPLYLKLNYFKKITMGWSRGIRQRRVKKVKATLCPPDWTKWLRLFHTGETRWPILVVAPVVYRFAARWPDATLVPHCWRPPPG